MIRSTHATRWRVRSRIVRRGASVPAVAPIDPRMRFDQRLPARRGDPRSTFRGSPTVVKSYDRYRVRAPTGRFRHVSTDPNRIRAIASSASELDRAPV